MVKGVRLVDFELKADMTSPTAAKELFGAREGQGEKSEANPRSRRPEPEGMMALEFNFDIDAQIERLAKVPKTVRLAVVSGFLVALTGAYWHFFYQPVRVRAQGARAPGAGAAARSEQRARRRLEHPGRRGRDRGHGARPRARPEAAPNRKQFEDLLQDISTAGKKVGVTIKSIERVAEVPRDFYAEVPFELEIEGSYHDLARFFEMVASLPRIVNIGSLDIQVSKRPRRATRLKVAGKARTYRFLANEA